MVAGVFEVADGRFALSARGRTLEIPVDSVVDARIERSVGERLRGLPVLRLVLAGGLDVRVASLAGAGSLHDLAGFAAPHLLGSGT